KRRSALATIHYADAPEGYVLYVKPMLLGNESADVRSYAATNPDFPHQSTSDQWFDESQTESYRLLGLCTMREVCGEQNSGPVPATAPLVSAAASMLCEAAHACQSGAST